MAQGGNMVQRNVIFGALVVLILAFALNVMGGDLEVPKYLSYQSVLFDDGGNPLSDGRHQIVFRLIGSSSETLFEEKQDVEVAGGVASVIVGSGTSVDDTMSNGGVPVDILKPDGARYLEVQVAGNQPMNRLELVSVPYAVYADVATHVANGGVNAEGIGEGVVQMKHLSKELVNELAVELASNANSPLVSRSEMTGIEGAARIGVNSTFVYSGAKDVEQVLRDMDMAIANRHAESVKKSGDTMNGKLDMGGNRISGLASPIDGGDAISVNTGDDRYVNAGGDVINGNLEVAGTLTINNNGAPIDVSNIKNIPGTLTPEQIPSPLRPHAWAVFAYDGAASLSMLKSYGIKGIELKQDALLGFAYIKITFENNTGDLNYPINISTDLAGVCSYGITDSHDVSGNVVDAARRLDGFNISKVHCSVPNLPQVMFNVLVFSS